MAWTLTHIWIYPIKSLPGLSVSQSEILPTGNLRHDREFAFFDAEGQYVNAKRTAKIHRIRASWDLPAWSVTLTSQESNSDTFHLNHDRQRLAAWVGNILEIPVRIEQRADGGFPDDEEASGPTVVATSTLKSVAAWFPGLTVEEIRCRFRANLELDGGESFREDQLFKAAGETVEFRIGDARLSGTNPCQRCVVPSRASQSGEIWPFFQKTFAEQRMATLPDWTDRSRFDHFYRLAVNTRVAAEQVQVIRIGDRVAVIG
ncbi:MAG: uncharacterized protein JWM11_4620 [Planctomycetaceae bacterium]|nr:uncharacterized protein [Planctomycetaceae bacterium]